MQLEITEAEQEILKRILDDAVSNLRVELRRTQTRDFHARLEAEVRLLQALIERLAGGG